MENQNKSLVTITIRNCDQDLKRDLEKIAERMEIKPTSLNRKILKQYRDKFKDQL